MDALMSDRVLASQIRVFAGAGTASIRVRRVRLRLVPRQVSHLYERSAAAKTVRSRVDGRAAAHCEMSLARELQYKRHRSRDTTVHKSAVRSNSTRRGGVQYLQLSADAALTSMPPVAQGLR